MDQSPTKEETLTISLESLFLPISIILASFIICAGQILIALNISNGLRNSDIKAQQDSNIPNNVADTQPTPGKTTLGTSAIKGNKEKAKVAIVEFSDYQCPFCKNFADNTLPSIKEKYINTNQVIFVYRDLPLDFHPNAFIQAKAARCAGIEGDEKYYQMHDLIYANGGNLDKNQLIELISQIQLNESDFKKCLDDSKIDELIKQDIKDANKAGISGTPGFIVGKLDKKGNVEGEVVSGAYPFETFQDIIESYLED